MKKFNHLLKAFLFISLFFLINQKVKAIDSYSPWDKEIVALFKAMPDQEEGRLKPMQTVARYKLLRINNSKRLVFLSMAKKLKFRQRNGFWIVCFDLNWPKRCQYLKSITRLLQNRLVLKPTHRQENVIHITKYLWFRTL